MNREKLEEVVAKLKEQRDELRVKAHLGSMEAKEEWAALEQKWKRLETRLLDAKDDARETSKEIGDGIDTVTEELGAAYRRIRERLKEE